MTWSDREGFDPSLPQTRPFPTQSDSDLPYFLNLSTKEEVLGKDVGDGDEEGVVGVEAPVIGLSFPVIKSKPIKEKSKRTGRE